MDSYAIFVTFSLLYIYDFSLKNYVLTLKYQISFHQQETAAYRRILFSIKLKCILVTDVISVRGKFQFESRSSHSEVVLGKDALKIYNKFTGGHAYRSVISTNLLSNLIEINFRHGCSHVNLLHISEHIFLKTPPGGCF